MTMNFLRKCHSGTGILPVQFLKRRATTRQAGSLSHYFFVAATLLLLTGCHTTAHAPTVDVLGSYFPAWIICILAGLGITLVVRLILVALKLNTHLRPAPLVYLCLMILFTLVVWLLFFKN
jgi:hypothetical protein